MFKENINLLIVGLLLLYYYYCIIGNVNDINQSQSRCYKDKITTIK